MRPRSRARTIAAALAPPRHDPWYTLWAIGVAVLMLALSVSLTLAAGGGGG